MATGGATIQAGSAGASEADECYAEWISLTSTIGFIGAGWSGAGQCYLLESDADLGLSGGAVVLDDEGRIVEVLGYSVLTLNELDTMGLADRRYRCHAGRTIKYECTPPY